MTGQIYIGTELHDYLEDKREEERWRGETDEYPTFREVVLDCLSDEAREEFLEEYKQGNEKYSRAS